jgi:hypothetical protein
MKASPTATTSFRALFLLVALSFVGVLAAAILSAFAVRQEHRWDAMNGPATWALALATLFSGAAIYLGFVMNAKEQYATRRAAQVREASAMLNRFRTNPWLVFFTQLIDWEAIGPRRMVVPAEAAMIIGVTVDYEPADLRAFLEERYSPGREHLKTYSDAFNVGLDYLTEIALMVENDIIPYNDLAMLAYFLEQMRRPDFAQGALQKYLTRYRYEAVLRLLARDPSTIAR